MILCVKFDVSECMFTTAKAFSKWDVLVPLHIDKNTKTIAG